MLSRLSQITVVYVRESRLNLACVLYNTWCRLNSRKPFTRPEIKGAIMSEHNDKSGRIFKQVLHVANAKLRDVVGLELVAESTDAAAEEDEGGATQAGPSQAGPSQAGPSQAAAPSKLLFLRSVLVDPITVDPPPEVGVYLAFVEVCLGLVQQSEGVIDEERMFEYLDKLGLGKEARLPRPAEQETVEALVSKRLVSEAWLRRIRKSNDQSTWQYVAGAIATINRDAEKADELRMAILTGEI